MSQDSPYLCLSNIIITYESQSFGAIFTLEGILSQKGDVTLLNVMYYNSTESVCKIFCGQVELTNDLTI